MDPIIPSMSDEPTLSHPFSPVEELVAEIAAGRMVIVVDDADRENEGDLIAAASSTTSETINGPMTFPAGSPR